MIATGNLVHFPAGVLPAGTDQVRVAVAVAVTTADMANARSMGRLQGCRRDDLAAWEVIAVAAEVQPQPH